MVMSVFSPFASNVNLSVVGTIRQRCAPVRRKLIDAQTSDTGPALHVSRTAPAHS
jgi:hypothetical protein